MKALLAAADAAKLLGVTPNTVRLMMRHGQLEVAMTTPGGIRLVRRATVERLARARMKGQPRSQQSPDGADNAAR